MILRFSSIVKEDKLILYSFNYQTKYIELKKIYENVRNILSKKKSIEIFWIVQKLIKKS